MDKTKFSKYNDGVVFLYTEKEKRSTFAAKENASALDDLNFVVKLDYEQAAKRQEDVEFAEQIGFALSLKVKTRFIPSINNKCKAVINKYLYDVKYVDDNRKEMWLYLEGVRSLAT